MSLRSNALNIQCQQKYTDISVHMKLVQRIPQSAHSAHSLLLIIIIKTIVSKIHTVQLLNTAVRVFVILYVISILF